jgi:hypothetical protein
LMLWNWRSSPAGARSAQILSTIPIMPRTALSRGT